MNDELYLWYEDKHQSLLQVESVIWVRTTRLLQVTQNKFAYICNISRKAGGDKVDFLLAGNSTT